LSVPCSTGEEPFSIAMALLDGGFPPRRFHIDAIDISNRAIAYAQCGIYDKNSFRARDLGFRDRYFEPLERGYRLSEGVRRQVHFRHGNLLARGWLHGAHGYHVIFCRNVLIYFDRPTQNRAIEVLGRLLTIGGLLFVGPSETASLLHHGFVSAGISLAFAFRQPDATAPTAKAARRSSAHLSRVRLAPVLGSRPGEPPLTDKAQPKPKAEANIVVAAGAWIEEARRLANRGSLVEALKCCEYNMRAQPTSAEALHLVGMLHDAAGHVDKAAEHYRKAVYLDPQHREALVHLAVALTKEGDASGAQRLFERAKRLSGEDR
jgi:chemotaxis protein methyltransferase WspC